MEILLLQMKGMKNMDLDFLNNKKEQKGITLIALVITVIVLLILARNKYKYAYGT